MEVGGKGFLGGREEGRWKRGRGDREGEGIGDRGRWKWTKRCQSRGDAVWQWGQQRWGEGVSGGGEEGMDEDTSAAREHHQHRSYLPKMQMRTAEAGGEGEARLA